MGIIVNSVNIIEVGQAENVFSIGERLNLSWISQMMASNLDQGSKGCPIISECRDIGREAT